MLALKGNQETLRREVQDHVFEHLRSDFVDVTDRRYTEQTQAHGRIEARTYGQLPVPESLSQRAKWKGLRTIGVAVRVCKQQGQETCEVRYSISLLKLGVRRFAAAVRGQMGDRELAALVAGHDVPGGRQAAQKLSSGEQSGVAEPVRDSPVEAADGQAKHRDAAAVGLLERGLPGASR